MGQLFEDVAIKEEKSIESLFEKLSMCEDPL